MEQLELVLDDDDLHSTSGTEVRTDVSVVLSETSDPGTKKRGWMLTINNPTQEDVDKLVADTYEYLVFQFERGESGTLHVQAFIYYKNPRVWPKRKYPNAHIEIAKSIQASIKYCKKEDTRVDGPWEYGTMPEQGRRTDLEEVAMKIVGGATIKKIADEHPEMIVRYSKGLRDLKMLTMKRRTTKPYVVWLWGLTGVGKTKYVWDKHGYDDGVVYEKPRGKWWDGYDQQEVVILDDLDESTIDFRELLKILDRYPHKVEVKGSFVELNSPFMYITSEYSPGTLFGETGNVYDQIRRRIDEVIELK